MHKTWNNTGSVGVKGIVHTQQCLLCTHYNLVTCYINIPDSHHVKLNWPYLPVPSLFLGYMVCGLWGNGDLTGSSKSQRHIVIIFGINEHVLRIRA